MLFSEYSGGVGWRLCYALVIARRRACPAGRAHFAWGGHFVTCVPCCGGWAALGLPLVGVSI